MKEFGLQMCPGSNSSAVTLGQALALPTSLSTVQSTTAAAGVMGVTGMLGGCVLLAHGGPQCIGGPQAGIVNGYALCV